MTDTTSNLSATFRAIHDAGVRDVSVSYLFLRPHIRRNVARADGGSFRPMLSEHYYETSQVQFHEESTPIQVPMWDWRSCLT